MAREVYIACSPNQLGNLRCTVAIGLLVRETAALPLPGNHVPTLPPNGGGHPSSAPSPLKSISFYHCVRTFFFGQETQY